MTLARDIDKIDKTCCIKGCSSKGEFQPYFRVKDPRNPDSVLAPAVEMFMQCTVCTEHRRQLTIGAVMTDNIWSHIKEAYFNVRGVFPNHKDVSLEFKSESGLVSIFGKSFKHDSQES